MLPGPPAELSAGRTRTRTHTHTHTHAHTHTHTHTQGKHLPQKTTSVRGAVGSRHPRGDRTQVLESHQEAVFPPLNLRPLSLFLLILIISCPTPGDIQVQATLPPPGQIPLQPDPLPGSRFRCGAALHQNSMVPSNYPPWLFPAQILVLFRVCARVFFAGTSELRVCSRLQVSRDAPHRTTTQLCAREPLHASRRVTWSDVLKESECQMFTRPSSE